MRRFTLADIFVGCGVLGVLLFMGAIAETKSVDAAKRAACASHLHQIGLALLFYGFANHNAFPQTIGDGTADPTPVWGTPYNEHKGLGPIKGADPFDGKTAAMPKPNDVTASMFLLLRMQKITPVLFVCPSAGISPFDFGGAGNNALQWTNWPGDRGLAEHLSYSFQDPFANDDARAMGFTLPAREATFAVAADMNPGTPELLSLTRTSSQREMMAGNSFNHQREGQNVLYTDGHCEFRVTPFCGTHGDNIYTAGGTEIASETRQAASLRTPPTDGWDSFLLPTATEVGFKMPAAPTAPDPKRVAELLSEVPGVYHGMRFGKPATITIDATKLTLKFTGPKGPVTRMFLCQLSGVDNQSVQLDLSESPTATLRDFVQPSKSGLVFTSYQFWSQHGWTRAAAAAPTTKTAP